MRTIIVCACALFFFSCQKEIMLPPPEECKEPHQVVPEPKQEPAPEPQPEPEPEPLPEPEIIYLSQLPNIFNSQNQYKLVEQYTEAEDLWSKVPEWAKDDVHIFHDMGDGLIKSGVEACPSDPFTEKELKWQAYADDEGVRLTWVDEEYKPVTYFISSIKEVTTFTIYQVKENTKVYSVFELIGK